MWMKVTYKCNEEEMVKLKNASSMFSSINFVKVKKKNLKAYYSKTVWCENEKPQIPTLY